MIRTTDRKSTPPAHACYEESPQQVLGIAFEKRDGAKRFLPYAFLSALDFISADEVIFHFSSGVVLVHGTALDAIWKAACNGQLAWVRECEPPSNHATAWVRQIAFSDTDPTPTQNLPPFPKEPPAN